LILTAQVHHVSKTLGL